MAEGVERFGPTLVNGGPGVDRQSDGPLVRYSDYEKLEAEWDEIRKERNKLAEHLQRTERQADQAHNQERQRIQEALKAELRRIEAQVEEVPGWGYYERAANAFARFKEALVLFFLDTLDPSREEMTPFEKRRAEEEASRAAYRAAVSHPSGEQGEESSEHWPEVWVRKDTLASPESGWMLVAPGHEQYPGGESPEPHYRVHRYVPATDT
jgi:hypothetical protein